MAEDMGGMQPPALKYLSVCSGIEAATVAWKPLGFQPLAFSEIEPFPRAVLAHHYPDVPLHGDFTRLRDEDWIADADILVGGGGVPARVRDQWLGWPVRVSALMAADLGIYAHRLEALLMEHVREQLQASSSDEFRLIGP